ncbi:hypothetical protein [Massilia antarctica]|uniref:hypothetical protein n=1 Tax=Massilia antarctica TaxID=2765360 RepID=UPI0006BB79FD|nr:hypothetical protein [Massilia sp. H27-R4]MCY0910437.1 hypothetical protein [Massilia sp. H27-R4]CUI09215.1 hypothetical protein BN2497_13207 [Janthinobacterium sp. CG23_2]CUU33001.1 hypothetical protein BN3177_13207 [Janthinobacterium sp. CG23_2]
MAARVPVPATLLLAAALALQVGYHAGRAPRQRAALTLAPAPPLAVLRLASLGEPVALAKAMTLYVQGQDEADTPLNAIDYSALRAWLERIVDLDPRGQAPLLAASQVYGASADPARTRIMLDFVYRRFGEDPDRRWPWLAHAALVARHRLHDPALARQYAQALRTRVTNAVLPAWARQMELFILDDMGEDDSATALIGAMVGSGQVSDPRERAFLERRLHNISARQRRADP